MFEPIAVVGFAFKLPAGINDEESLWRVVLNGESGLTDVPEDRLNLETFRDMNFGDNVKPKGYFINSNIAEFDAPFFSITAEEAIAMDPQQRLLLETTYHAVENAGITLESLKGSRTSVHVGCLSQDYKLSNAKDPEIAAKYSATGDELSILSNRISWFFNLKGPSMSVETACSSSLVALDLACQLLRSGETDMGVVAGSSLIHGPDFYLNLSNMGFLSPDNRCYSFDSRGNGYSRAEGLGVLIIQRVSDAIRQNRTIRAVIRSSGSNSDGRTPGLTQPSGEAQLSLIRDCYEKSGLSMKDTRYVEAHGTGTMIGDPIEAHAIGAAFDRSKDDPIYLGSIKANLGHMEANSGIGGVIKTILTLERGIIPPIADLATLNPNINDKHYNLKFPREPVPWPTNGLRRASVNSFGFGGSNAHVVLDDAKGFLAEIGIEANHNTKTSGLTINKLQPAENLDKEQVNKTSNKDSRPYLLQLTTADKDGVKRLGKMYNEYFKNLALGSNEIDETLKRLTYTLNQCRTQLPWKSYAVVDSHESLLAINEKFSAPRQAVLNPSIAFVFTGQGAQWPKMGIELMIYPVFAESIRQSAAYLASFGCIWDIETELKAEVASSHVHDPAFSQPLCIAIQIALVDLLAHIGITPKIVLGHSSGEIAAAYCNTSISQESAMKVAYFRGMAAAAVARDPTTNGTMMSVGLSENEISSILKALSLEGYSDLYIGCINSPTNVTVAGDSSDMDVLKSRLDEKGTFARKLKVPCAYHSPHMVASAKEYLEKAGKLEAGKDRKTRASIPLISYLTGQEVSSSRLQEVDYWVENFCSAVNFTKSVQMIDYLASNAHASRPRKLGVPRPKNISITNILEIGPHGALRGPLRDIMQTFKYARDIQYTTALVRGSSASKTFLEAVGSLQCSGVEPNIPYLNATDNVRVSPLLNLPSYPFAHAREFWSENRRSKNQRLRKFKPTELLGSSTPESNPFISSWRNFLNRSNSPWIEDHSINGVVIYPAAGMLIMAIEALNQHAKGVLDVTPRAFCVKDAGFLAAMQIPEAPLELEVHTYLRMVGERTLKPDAWYEFSIVSYSEGSWKLHSKGLIRAEIGDGNSKRGGPSVNDSLSTEYLPSSEFYDRARNAGYTFGPLFQRISKIQLPTQGETLGQIQVYKNSNTRARHRARAMDESHLIHPTTLDAFLHFPLTDLFRDPSISPPTVIPTRIKKLWLSATGLNQNTSSTLSAFSKRETSGYRGYDFSIIGTGSQNDIKLEISGYEMTRVSDSTHDPARRTFQGDVHTCWGPNWEPLEATTDEPSNTTADRPTKQETSTKANSYAEIHTHGSTTSTLELAKGLQLKLQEECNWDCKIIPFDSIESESFDSQADIKIILWDVDKESILAKPTEEGLSRIQSVLDTRNSILWIQTADQVAVEYSSQHLIDGLSRATRLENNMVNFATLSVTSGDVPGRTDAISRVCQVLSSSAKTRSSEVPQTFKETSDGDIEVLSLVERVDMTKLVQSTRSAPEPKPVPWDVKNPLTMVVESPGVLDSIRFIEDSGFTDILQENEIEVEVKAVGVNFKDCLIALGALNENSIGSEVAGVVTRIGPNTINHGLQPGSRVFGFSTNGYRTLFRNHAESFSVIPDDLTFAEAASIPINFATAWHSLQHIARLQPGETVLIHSAAGGTGQAAIQIAQYLGATVFATVGTDEKRNLLATRYGVPPERIFNSRDANGITEVKNATGGHGVDVVFNSLSGDMLFNSWDCIAPFGRFIEIGKKDIQAGNQLPMAQFEKNCSFSAVDLGHMFQKRPKQVTGLINECIDLFNKKNLQTVYPLHKFGVPDLIEAFRLMQGGKSSGKIVVEMLPQHSVQAFVKTGQELLFNSDSSYIIAGGLGGLGRDIARWMADRGARHLVLLSRSGANTEAAISLMAELNALGVECVTPCCDISDGQALEEVLKSVTETVPPIKGCIQASMVLRSNLFAAMSHTEYSETLECKVAGSWNLHTLLPKDLDFFLLLSSVQGLIGSRTQSNYAAANTYLDALAQHRIAHGLKAMSLQLGLMDTDGYLAEHKEEKHMMLAQQTYIPVQRCDFHALLEHYCNADLPLPQPGAEQLTLGLRLLNVNPELDPLGTSWGKNPMFKALRRVSEDVTGLPEMNVPSRFFAANTTEEAATVVMAALIERIASSIAGMSIQDIEPNKAIQDYGVDSLQTMELRSWFLKTFQSDLPAFEILGASSLTALSNILIDRSPLQSKFRAK
ncbi:hypothetical protein TWF694_004416 [Orbilia ellipsospora]|uniref:Polyketide synthase n=1 Tax=Orbilia ellipsospora TaxID=2528407 RepID=A0AAV9WV77_9PEZI